MITIYKTSANNEIHCEHYTAYMRNKSGITNIFYDLWNSLQECDVKFEDLKSHLLEVKGKSESKAYCNISQGNDIIEINQYGVLPIIWIEKN